MSGRNLRRLQGAAEAALLLGLALLVLWQGLALHTPDQPFTSPGLLPVVVGICLLAVSAAMLLRALWPRREPAGPAGRGAVDFRRAWAAAGMFALYLAGLSLPFRGFLPLSVLLAAGMQLFLGERKPQRLVLLAVALPVALYLVFSLLFGVEMP